MTQQDFSVVSEAIKTKIEQQNTELETLKTQFKTLIADLSEEVPEFKTALTKLAKEKKLFDQFGLEKTMHEKDYVADRDPTPTVISYDLVENSLGMFDSS